MQNLIPQFIHEQLAANVHSGSFEAQAMFVDLSGFTRLTETLMQQGKAGAERLSVILNAIFEPMVRLTYEHGGFIPYFAGDAFTAIFPLVPSRQMAGGSAQVSAEQMLALAQRQFELLKQASTYFKEFQIGMKIGLSFGEVEWGIVGAVHKSFYFRGSAVQGAADSQSQAKQQEIIVNETFIRHLTEPVQMTPLAEKGYFSVSLGQPGISTEALDKAKVMEGAVYQVRESSLKSFLADEVVELSGGGEFRTVVPVFIAFEGTDDHDSLDAFATVVLDQARNFSGYFKEIDFGDKGGVLVIIFGAPVSYENNVERALEFVCAVHDDLLPVQHDTGLKYKVGVASGTAFTGMVGGKARSQYAAVGNRVNIAARLMMKANWGEVLADNEVQKSRHFRFQDKGKLSYKGLKDPIPTFKLVGRNAEQRRSFEGVMVGRSGELKRLLDFAQTAFNENSPAVAFVYGEPGIGKSRLSFELRQRLRRQRQASWFTCQSDQILRKAFNPFIYFLRNYFEQSSEHTPDENLDSFERQYEALLLEIVDERRAEAEGIKRELVRTKPVLAALVGLKTANTLWENLDAKGRYLNTLAALTAFFLAEAMLQPVVVELEDGHWYDDNSKEFLNDFALRTRGFPIFFLVTSRYDDEGGKPKVFAQSALERSAMPQLEIDLNILDAGAMRIFAAERLRGHVSQKLLELLLRTTNGNPFYAEQMLEYFLESEQLELSEDGWEVKDENVGLSESIQAVLTARIDRLSTLVKETVKAAAVIGREFELPVLTEVMKGNETFLEENGNAQTVLREQVKTAERAQIWQAMNELRYIFRHSLLREAVYDMQLKTRLRELHRHIAEAIENLYADNLEHRYVDLVFHYEQAEVEGKLEEYLQKAADYAKGHYQNQQALHFYNKLLTILEKQNDRKEIAETLLKKGSILELIGRWDECETIYRQALDLARDTNDSRLLGRANNNLGYLLMLKGKYEEADGNLETAAAFFGSSHDNRGTSKVYGNLGTLYFRQGKYEDAKLYFIRSIQLAQLYKHTPATAQIVATLGLTYMNMGKYEDGIRWQKSQLDLCKRENDRQGMATLYTNMGIVHFEKGDYDAALTCYQRGLALAEELGNKQLVSIAIGCIGTVLQRKGKFDLAMQHFVKDLALVEELGDRQGISIALGLMGELYSIMGEFDKAVEYLQRNLAIGKELGYRKGVAKALNNLGDIYFYKDDYPTSLDYYDQAIQLTRDIGNRLVLGMSLVEKGKVLVAMKELEAAHQHWQEASTLAKELDHAELLFETKLLAARLFIAKGEDAKARSLLQGLLQRKLGKREEAAVHFKLSKIEGGESHREQALALYRELFEETPMFVFKVRMEELNK